MREASRMEWRVANNKFSIMNARRRETKMSRSTNYTACTFPLMRRCCMAGPTGPAGISSFHAMVTVDFIAQQRW